MIRVVPLATNPKIKLSKLAEDAVEAEVPSAAEVPSVVEAVADTRVQEIREGIVKWTTTRVRIRTQAGIQLAGAVCVTLAINQAIGPLNAPTRSKARSGSSVTRND